MNDEKELYFVIEESIKKEIEKAISDLKMKTIQENDPKGMYKKVEALLYNYPTLNNVLSEKEEMKAEIMQYGVRHASKGITSVVGSSGYIEVKSDYERKEERIEGIERAIQKIKKQIDTINRALNHVKDNSYYKIIPMRYFQSKTYDQIADHFGVSVDVIKEEKNKLIHELVRIIYPEEYLSEIISWLVV